MMTLDEGNRRDQDVIFCCKIKMYTYIKLMYLFLVTNQTMQIVDNQVQQFICHCPVTYVLEIIKLLPRSQGKKTLSLAVNVFAFQEGGLSIV